MAIWEKDGIFHVDGTDQTFPRIEEARVVNQQIKAGTEFKQGQAGVATVTETPEFAEAREKQSSEQITQAMPAVAATGLGMAFPPSAAVTLPARILAGTGQVLGRAGLQGAAEIARQKLMGEETDVSKAAESATISAGTEGALAIPGAAVKGAIKMAPGIQERLAASEIPVLKSIGQRFQITPNRPAVRAAYAEVERLGQGFPQGVPLDQSNQPLRDLFQAMRFRKGGEQQKELLADLARTTQSPIKSFADVDSLLHKVNQTLQGAATPEERRLVYKVKDAIWKDIDNAQVPPAQKAAYRKAVSLAKKNFAYEQVDEMINDALTGSASVAQQTATTIPQTKTLLGNFREAANDPSFVAALGGEAKVKAIDDFVTKIHQKIATGSKIGTASILGGTGAMIGSALAGPAGAGLGAVAGIALPAGISKLANNPKAAALFLKLIDPNTRTIPRQVFTGLVNALVAGNQ